MPTGSPTILARSTQRSRPETPPVLPRIAFRMCSICAAPAWRLIPLARPRWWRFIRHASRYGQVKARLPSRVASAFICIPMGLSPFQKRQCCRGAESAAFSMPQAMVTFDPRVAAFSYSKTTIWRLPTATTSWQSSRHPRSIATAKNPD